MEQVGGQTGLRCTQHTVLACDVSRVRRRDPHIVAQAAKAGKRHLTRIVFDGSALDSPYEVTAFIGAERAPGGEDIPTFVSDKRSWFFRLAYFKQAAIEPSPEFELSAVLYENGVAGDMIYDYGDFSIDVKLRELEILPVQECTVN